MQGTDRATPSGGARSSSSNPRQTARDAPAAALVVRVEADDGTAILRLAGELRHSNEAEALIGLREALERSESGRVLIDLRELTFIDLTGTVFLVGAIDGQDRDTRSFLASDASQVRRILARAGLDRFIASGDGASGDRSMGFRVERQLKGAWHVVAHAIEAGSPLQAVIRGCEDEGLYRARSASASADDGYHHFWAPPWGQPEPVRESPAMPTSSRRQRLVLVNRCLAPAGSPRASSYICDASRPGNAWEAAGRIWQSHPPAGGRAGRRSQIVSPRHLKRQLRRVSGA
jgi:anti-anti-sigma factor